MIEFAIKLAIVVYVVGVGWSKLSGKDWKASLLWPVSWWNKNKPTDPTAKN
jgi:hypothetical protein